MKLEHFRYLLEINRLHSISAAARSLHISQTTLSSVVKNIETELGFPVFQRTPDGVAATTDGKKLMELAWDVNIKYEELTKLRDRTKDEPQFITLPICPIALNGMAIPLSEKFYKMNLNRHLSYLECPSSKIYQLIATNAANVGIAFLSRRELDDFRAAENSGVKIKELFQDRMYVFVSKKHRLAVYDSITPEEIYKERIALVNKPERDKVLGDMLLKSDRVSVFGSVELMKQAVMLQNMVSIQPGYTVYCDGIRDSQHYSIVPLNDTPEENVIYACMIYQDGRGMHYQEKMFVSCVLDYFETMPEIVF